MAKATSFEKENGVREENQKADLEKEMQKARGWARIGTILACVISVDALLK